MYAVIGSNGYLGSYIVRSLLSETKEEIVCAARRSKLPFNGGDRLIERRLDITDRNSADEFAERFSSVPIKMIMLATVHNPDVVAVEFRRAWDTNITSLSYLINRVDNLESLYYASTDSVYGESMGGYHFRETDASAPVNPYGRQKLAAEHVITGFGGRVARFPFLIGKSLLPDKPHFYDNIVKSLSAGIPVEMLSDSFRSSLDFAGAADMLVKLTKMDQRQVPALINICGDDDLSKYDVGVIIADKLGVSRELVVPVALAQSQIYATPRAGSTLMDNSLFKSLMKISELRLSL